MKKIRTMLCDDYKYICEYFKSSLSEYDDIDVVAVANSSEEALQMVAVHHTCSEIRFFIQFRF